VRAAGAFKLYIGGRAIPGSQVLIGALVVVVLLVVVVSSIAGGGGGAAEAGAGDAGYSASFSAICNQAKAGWDLVGDYQFSGGTTPPGAILGGECALTPSSRAALSFVLTFASCLSPAVASGRRAWVDDEYGVTVDGEGDFVSLGPNSAEGWAVDGDFTISFMFTNQACRIPVRTAQPAASSPAQQPQPQPQPPLAPPFPLPVRPRQTKTRGADDLALGAGVLRDALPGAGSVRRGRLRRRLELQPQRRRQRRHHHHDGLRQRLRRPLVRLR